jgi:hypothetical protein
LLQFASREDKDNQSNIRLPLFFLLVCKIVLPSLLLYLIRIRGRQVTSYCVEVKKSIKKTGKGRKKK